MRRHDRQRHRRAIISLVGLGNKVVGINHHTQDTITGFLIDLRRIGHLQDRSAARLDQFNPRHVAHRGRLTVADVEQLHFHIPGRHRAQVLHHNGDSHCLARGRLLRTKADARAAYNQIRQLVGADGQRRRGFVVVLILFRDQIVGIDQNLDAPVAHHAGRVIGDLRGCAAARRDAFNRLFQPDRVKRAVGHVDELDQHSLRRNRAVVDHHSRNAHHVARGWHRRVKDEIRRHHRQIGRGLRRHRQCLAGFVVLFVGFDHKVVGVNHHLNLACAAAPRGRIDHRHLGAAARREQRDLLAFANRQRRPRGRVEELHHHALSRCAPDVLDHGTHRHILAFHRLCRVKADVIGSDRQVRNGRRRNAQGHGGFVVGFAPLRNEVIRVDRDLHLAVTRQARSGVGNLRRRAAARRNDLDGLRIANGCLAAGQGRVCKLHDHILRGLFAVVEDSRYHRDHIACCRRRGVKAHVG